MKRISIVFLVLVLAVGLAARTPAAIKVYGETMINGSTKDNLSGDSFDLEYSLLGAEMPLGSFLLRAELGFGKQDVTENDIQIVQLGAGFKIFGEEKNNLYIVGDLVNVEILEGGDTINLDGILLGGLGSFEFAEGCYVDGYLGFSVDGSVGVNGIEVPGDASFMLYKVKCNWDCMDNLQLSLGYRNYSQKFVSGGTTLMDGTLSGITLGAAYSF
ncbi:MAG: hypothetical protein ACM3WV_10920 [Bacillota bacterium]